MKTKILCLAAVFALCGSTGFAQNMVEALDIDKDELVSMEEAKAIPELAEQFAALDANKDGQLDGAEIMAFKKAE